MRKWILTMSMWLVLTLVGTAAHAQLSGTDFDGASVRTAQAVEEGVVLDVVDSTIHTPAPVAARVAGSALAGAGCSRMTAKWSSWVARAGVVAACAAGGERLGAQLGAGAVSGKTIIVKLLGSGRILAVAQADEHFNKDQRVWVLIGHGTRVLSSRM